MICFLISFFKLERKLARRVEGAIKVWTSTLNQTAEGQENKNINPKIETIPVEIRIVSQSITIIPSLEEVRNILLNQFYSWHGIVTLLPRISCTRLKVNFPVSSIFCGCNYDSY